MGGALAQLSATELAVVILSELARRTGLGEGDVDDVILGNGYANGESPAIGRIAALDAGLGTGVPGLQIDRRCGSGLQAVLYACRAGRHRRGSRGRRRRGGVDVERRALRPRPAHRRPQGGIQLMDRLDRARETAGGAYHPVPGGMIETAENLRREYSISREEQDELAVRSHHRAVAAHQAGQFADELVPVTVPGTRGKPDTVVDRDETPPGRHDRRGLGRASPDPGQARSRVHRHRRQRLRAERRRRDVRRHHPRRGRQARAGPAAGAAVLGGRPAAPRSAWASARSAPPRQPSTVPALRSTRSTSSSSTRHSPPRSSPCLHEWKVDPLDDRLNPNGSGISPRPPHRRHRRAHPRHRRTRGQAPRGALRPRDDVHRRRPGPGRGLRGGPMSAVQVGHVVTERPDVITPALINHLEQS